MPNLISVSNYAAARAIDGATLSDGELRYVGSRASPGDGGDGVFYWESAATAADNDGTVLKLANSETGRLIRDRTGVINVQWFGATGDGVTDDAPAVQKAIASMVDGSTLWFPPAVYVMEGFQDHPHPDNAGKKIAALFDGLNDIAVLGFGATLKQVTTRSVQGVLHFHNCNHVRALGFHLDGIFDQPSQSGTLYRASGACDGLTFEGSVDGGNALAVFDEASGSNQTTDRPKNTVVRGIAKNCQYGINYIHAGRGHSFDLVVENVLRGVFFVGLRNCVGKVAAVATTGNVLNFSTRSGGVIEDVDVAMTGTDLTNPVRFKVSDATECAIRRVRVSGTAEVSQGVGVLFETLGNAGSMVEDVDLSDLSVRVFDATSNGQCVKLPGNALGTLRRVTLPRVASTNVGGRSVVDLSHGGLAVQELTIPQGWRYERLAPGASGILIKAANAIADMDIGSGHGRYEGTTSNPINLSGVSDLRIADVRVEGGGLIYPSGVRRTVPVEELVLGSSGSPVGSVTPAFVGQRYHDTATSSPRRIYEAIGPAASDWEALN